ncbi:MAG TPA: GntP family permease [Bacteroidales bacterium]|nr:GntP family permease [Bacteroidales bacterium]
MILTFLLVGLSILAIILLTSKFRLQAFIALFLVSVFLAVTTLPKDKVLTVLKEGFGGTMASIGLLIILGAIIGITLDKSGATISIAKFILGKTGSNRSAEAIGMTGFISGIPIFCDSGFIILSGLARSFSFSSGVAMPFMASVLATSLYSVHCLIPPHPGALAAAGLLEVNIGYLIIAGILFAIPGVIAAYFWSRWITAKGDYAPAGINGTVASEEKKLPSAFLSFLPIVVPLILITARSFVSLFDTSGDSVIYKILFFPGEPVFALAIGVILALMLLQNRNAESINSIFINAVEKAGPILIITAAGGMFGMVIKSTGSGEALGNVLAGTSLGLAVPFIIAVIMKTAQGSSTVAIITTASFVAPMLSMLGLDSENGRLLAMLSMGAGSMIVSHANDSYFWVITNFSGIDPGVNLKIYSTSTIVMGITVFLCVFCVSMLVL